MSNRIIIGHSAPQKVYVDRDWKGSSQHILMLESGAELGSQLRRAVLCGKRPPSDGWNLIKDPVTHLTCKQCVRVYRKQEEHENQ